MKFFVSSCLFNVAFTICLGVLSFCSFLFDFFFFFSPLLLFSISFFLFYAVVACGVLVLYQGAGPESQRWETEVQVHWTTRGLPTSWNIN